MPNQNKIKWDDLHPDDRTIVRCNLINDPSYTPYCGNDLPARNIGGCNNPRTDWVHSIGQFKCYRCGYTTEFPTDFINRYKQSHNIK